MATLSSLLMSVGRLVRRAVGGQKPCTHTDQIAEIEPDSPDSCTDCTAIGDTWVNLRVCLVCGHVACCDNSKNRHARRHWEGTGHPLIQSYQPGETWRWCWVDDTALPDGPPLRKR